ncbi:hypothetical protein ASE40_15135 [Flavobacterium sp. Root935]|uniref:hypothetical protein n=1 Tax=Flavobacterium sp. Root935 TaxID=1736610 RepID=UPI0007099B36|nr:hypothetical protein [Flavobacterium sp. Root935]KRD57696.1 hypothetical protein ASE40_15135 [Flavobacterium sp. Root935]
MKSIKLTVSSINLDEGNFNPDNFLNQATKQLNTIEYVIYLNQITCISSNINGGTDIRLSCGKEISLLDKVETVEKLIEDTYNS